MLEEALGIRPSAPFLRVNRDGLHLYERPFLPGSRIDAGTAQTGIANFHQEQLTHYGQAPGLRQGCESNRSTICESSRRFCQISLPIQPTWESAADSRQVLLGLPGFVERLYCSPRLGSPETAAFRSR